MIGSTDDDETLWTVAFDDDRDPGATYLFDRRTGESRLLFRSRPWLDPTILAERTPVRITSRDGLTLPSYLTLPVGADPTRPADGAATCTAARGRATAGAGSPPPQFLANRGYAVLQVNYRGSTGFGKAFTHAAEKEFAGKMHDDLIDGVDWFVAEGIADRKRVAIYGGSYGGYAALVGATLHAGRVRRGDQRGRPVEPGDPGAELPALLAPAARRHVVQVRRRPGRPGRAQGPGGPLTDQPGRPDHRAAPGAAGRQRPAGQQSRVRPDRRSPARPRRPGRVHRQGRRGPRLRQTREQARTSTARSSGSWRRTWGPVQRKSPSVDWKTVRFVPHGRPADPNAVAVDDGGR